MRASRALYSFVRLLVRVILRACNRMKVTSQTTVPSAGPLVIVANHESVLDGFVLAAAFPKRRLTFLSASYLFDKPFTGAFLRAMGALPVKTQGRNFGSLRQAIAVLRRGGTVAVFPEGGILGSEILGGAVYLALKADAPILPVYLKGTKEVLPPGRRIPFPSAIEAVLGSPFHVARSTEGPKGSRREVSEGRQLLERMLDQVRPTETREEGTLLDWMPGVIR